MKNPSIVAALVVVIVCGAVYAVRTMRSQAHEPKPAQASLPIRFQFLKRGMAEQDVSAHLGHPSSRHFNPHYEIKTPQEWQKLDAESSQGPSSNAPPTKEALRAAAQLEHRIKDVWLYDANGGEVVLSFDGAGRLLRWSTTNPTGQQKS